MATDGNLFQAKKSVLIGQRPYGRVGFRDQYSYAHQRLTAIGIDHLPPDGLGRGLGDEQRG